MSDIDIIMAKLNDLDSKLSNIPQVAAAPPPEIIDTAELCKRLSISEPTAIKMRKGKKPLPFIKLGSSVRFNWPVVVAYLETKSKS